MQAESQEAVRLDLTFPDRAKAKQAFEQLSQSSDERLNILRGRFTKKAAWLEVEVRGDSGTLDEVFRLGRTCGASVRRVP
jgi:hypothetical protein